MTKPNATRPGKARLTPINQQLLNERMSNLALSERRLTSQSGMAHVSFRMARLQGHIPDHTSLSQLHRLAAELGTTTLELLTVNTPETAPQPVDVDPDAASDAAMLIPHLVTIPRRLQITYMARVLNWPLPRLQDALTAIEQALTGTGLTLHNTGDAIRIVPTNQRDTTIRSRLATAQTKTGGLDKGTARTLRGIYDGTHTGHRNIGNAERVNLGTLSNLGCIQIGDRGQWTPTDAFKAAHPE